jgi:U3 small nucleolar ribonucleoprotein component
MGIIIDRVNEETFKMVKERFIKVIEKYHDSPEFENDYQPLTLLLMLERYSGSFMQKLVRDALRHDYWHDEQFKVRLPYVVMGLEMLHSKDPEAFKWIKNYLVNIITDPKEDQRTINRALELHNRLKGLRLL